MNFNRLDKNDSLQIKKMSLLATTILREYYDPIVGKTQNDYMLNKFQSVEGITDQLNHNYQYYFIVLDNIEIGFIAFYEKKDVMYLSKLYLVKEYRGKGLARKVIDFVLEKTKEANLLGVELNVNKHNPTCLIYEKMGFTKIRDEVNDIGCGYVMDDYVYYYDIK